ncbi:MAG: ATP synthase F1 subunit delta [Taibaiella sp.]|nr:ATP synthase F1 subunit delta [Taibaiella sp.]
MPNPRLASRYAKSIFDLALEKNSLEETLKDMQLLSNICHQNPDFENMLRSPIIKGDKKLHILDAILAGHINNITKGFLQLLVGKSRESYLPEIAQAFITLYKETKKIKTVRLTTAAPITDAVKNAILAKVTGGLEGYSIDLTATVDPSLIGGFVLEMDDKLFDSSVRRDLKEIRSQFSDNSYMGSLN